MRRALEWATLLLVCAGCHTTMESEVAAVSESPSPMPPAIELPGTCPAGDVICTEEFIPTACSAISTAGKTLDEPLRAYGDNPCLAKKALAVAACRRGIQPKELGGLTCIPDSTGGNCPIEDVVCDTRYDPHICTASKYNGQKLTNKQIITSSGANSCVAIMRMKEKVCASNLNPELLGDISCMKETQTSGCSGEPDDCINVDDLKGS